MSLTDPVQRVQDGLIMPPDAPKLEEIFHAALEIESAAARETFLDQACGNDDALRRQIQILLNAERAAEDFFKTGEARSDQEPQDASRVQPELAAEQAGSFIGHYKLLEKLGEGGLGIVYRAEQSEPVKRQVALKIIKLGMDTREAIQRFAAERQALAMMEHPNIAAVYDAGATPTGRPFFVMELVRGNPITTYCDAQGLSIAQRLQLFIEVCH